MRELALVGLIALLFGLGSFYATEHLGAFSAVNLGLGALALLLALARGLRRVGATSSPESRRLLARGLGLVALAALAAVGLERGAARAGVKLDWTFERRYELSPAVRELLARLPPEGIDATLWRDEFDPRARRSRLLLEQLADASGGRLRVRERVLGEHPDEEDRYGIGSSNTALLALGERFETVERPSEGTLFEALHRLLSVEAGTLALLRGEGEGNPLRDREIDSSGLAVALQTEGYRVLSLVTAAVAEIPEEADGVVLLGARRPLLDASIAMLRRYLERGGSLVALVEPGVATGVEALLAEYGIESPDAVLLDPASGALDAEQEGVDVIAYNYELHPITRGLDGSRMTFFRGARSFLLRKPRPDDELRRIVLSSPYAWLAPGSAALTQRSARRPPSQAERSYHTIAAAGRYARGGGETRIFAVGDADFASNRFLRALYNLDLVMNGVHWAVSREPAITIRPKIGALVQFPLPVANSLRTLYGVGLLVPELLLLAGGIVWLRRRAG
jgi:hypothetical protein